MLVSFLHRGTVGYMHVVMQVA